MNTDTSLNTEVWESNGHAYFNSFEFYNRSNQPCYISASNEEISYVEILVAFTDLLNRDRYKESLIFNLDITLDGDIDDDIEMMDLDEFYEFATTLSYADYREHLIHEFFEKVTAGLSMEL